MEPTKIEPLLLTVEQAAACLGVRPCTIRKLVHDGALSYVEFGGKFCVRYADLKKFVAENRRTKWKSTRPKPTAAIAKNVEIAAKKSGSIDGTSGSDAFLG